MKKRVYREKYYKLPNEVKIELTEEGIKVKPVDEKPKRKRTTKKKGE